MLVACITTNLRTNNVVLRNIGGCVVETGYLLEVTRLCLVLKAEEGKEAGGKMVGGYMIVVVRIQSTSSNAVCC